MAKIAATSGEQAEGREPEIVAAIEARREGLRDAPHDDCAPDAATRALGARGELLDHITRLTRPQATGAAIKAVAMGSVPDRGGDAKKRRPHASELMPEWQAHRPLESGKGKGGGNGKGGKGGGRGGGGRKRGRGGS